MPEIVAQVIISIKGEIIGIGSRMAISTSKIRKMIAII
jgi:hypothetical protein